MNIRITEDYFKAKLEELTLTLEYQEKKKIKKLFIREQMKEEAKKKVEK